MAKQVRHTITSLALIFLAISGARQHTVKI
jgi:hypothetical protein